MEANMFVELLKSSPTLAAVIVVVFAFLKSQRDMTTDFKEVVREIHSDMKNMHTTAISRLEQAAQAGVQNAISTNNNTQEIQKLSIEVRRLADKMGT